MCFCAEPLKLGFIGVFDQPAFPLFSFTNAETAKETHGKAEKPSLKSNIGGVLNQPKKESIIGRARFYICKIWPGSAYRQFGGGRPLAENISVIIPLLFLVSLRIKFSVIAFEC